jgi:hypothetical protein
MKKNTQWFSIIIAIWLVLFISLSSYVILDTIVPFSKNTKWMEQSTSAYYLAGAWIEKALFHVAKRGDLTTDGILLMSPTSTWFSFNTFSIGTNIPEPWYWNSEYNADYNQISLVEQLQLEVWNNMVTDWSMVDFYFKVPAFTGWTLTLSWWSSPIINWILSNEDDSLIATWSYLQASQISNSSNTASTWKINSKDGLTLWWATQTFSSFYTTNCQTKSCILKMSIVNDLVLSTWNTKIPYLEYRINFGGQNVPQRYTLIQASWKAYGFKKDLEVQVPQQTVNQAFDFTVFQ